MQDIIHVVESKPSKLYGDYFLRQILKVCCLALYLINNFTKALK